jgi:hypothetical protein
MDGFRTQLYQTQLCRKLRRLELDEPTGEPGPRISGYGTLLVTSPTQVVLLQQLQVLNVTVQKAGLKLSPGPRVFPTYSKQLKHPTHEM